MWNPFKTKREAPRKVITQDCVNHQPKTKTQRPTMAEEFINVLSCATEPHQAAYATIAMLHKLGPTRIVRKESKRWSAEVGDVMSAYEVTFADKTSVVVKLP